MLPSLRSVASMPENVMRYTEGLNPYRMIAVGCIIIGSGLILSVLPITALSAVFLKMISLVVVFAGSVIATIGAYHHYYTSSYSIESATSIVVAEESSVEDLEEVDLDSIEGSETINCSPGESTPESDTIQYAAYNCGQARERLIGQYLYEMAQLEEQIMTILPVPHGFMQALFERRHQLEQSYLTRLEFLSKLPNHARIMRV